MQRRAALVAVAGFAFIVSHALAKPNQPHELSEYEVDVDVVGDVDGTNPAPQKVLQDTIWIADWSFDTGAPCSEAEWVHVDNRILNDGTSYWHAQVAADFPAQTSGMAGNVYALGYHDNASVRARAGTRATGTKPTGRHRVSMFSVSSTARKSNRRSSS